MLFNSFEFIFFFLPLSVWLYFLLGRLYGKEMGILVLVFSSLFFYGWWNPDYLLLLLFSIGFNYLFGRLLSRHAKRWLLSVGVAVNLALIAYFKYAFFIVDNLSPLLGSSWNVENIILPLAISFFTFQQIAYLVDSYRGITSEYNFLHYCLFVAFFPQLIAGPIVHHKQMLPQFERTDALTLKAENIAIGLSIFSVGLFKKTVLADGIAVYANPVFASADAGQSLHFFEAWAGVLAYTFQLYFDFSGYSDMAIGVARIFGIVLPLNFYSPYKALSISEFWRRWHITLSTFLREYLYIALGGNRKGQLSRYRNLMITMLLGGLWHGAGWNFIFWGGLHGAYLSVNHAWTAVHKKMGFKLHGSAVYVIVSWMVTFLAVVVGWVYFRAETLSGAHSLLYSMTGLNGVTLPNAIWVNLGGLSDVLASLGIEPEIGGGSQFVKSWLWILVSLFICLMLPNTQDMFSSVRSSLSDIAYVRHQALWPAYQWSSRISWVYSTKWAACIAIMLIAGLLTLFQVSEFLYFQF